MDQRKIRHWYQSFFQDIALDYWFAKTSDPATIQHETDRLVHHLDHQPPAKLLDIPCGFGFHATALAAQGFDVDGIDAAETCVRHAKSMGMTNSHFDIGRMESLALSAETYDGAYCIGNSVGYVAPDETRAFFHSVATALKQKGRFILSTGMVSEAILPNLTDQAWEKAGNIYFLQEHDYDEKASLLITNCTFLDIENTREEKRTLYHYVTPLATLKEWLEETGMAVLQTLSHDDDVAFEEGDAAVYIVCEKG